MGYLLYIHALNILVTFIEYPNILFNKCNRKIEKL